LIRARIGIESGPMLDTARPFGYSLNVALQRDLPCP